MRVPARATPSSPSRITTDVCSTPRGFAATRRRSRPRSTPPSRRPWSRRCARRDSLIVAVSRASGGYVRTSIVAIVLGLAACGGGGTDIDSTLVFADRSDAEIARLINAGTGSDMFSTQSQIDQFGDTFDADPCPAV